MPTERPDSRLTPNGGAPIVDNGVFRMLVDLETRKAQRLRYWVSVVRVGVEGSAAGSPATDLARRIAPGIRATDAVTAEDPRSVSVLLIDAEAANLPTILARLAGALEDVSWSAGGACYPKTAASASDLIEQATTMMTQAKQDGGRRLYVAA